jgi:formyltetrahydrofolate-dependent phosphoribosylglycinamide formyltransferase
VNQSYPLSPLRLAVLISGGGTTLRNFIERIEAGTLDAEIARVVSSNPNAGGIAIARDAAIPVSIIERRDYADDDSFGAAVFEVCRNDRVDLVTMAGFLKFAPVPDDFLGRVMNIHPALIPAFCGAGFYGRRVHETVLEYGAKVSGCTVHFVDNQYDHGPVILQQTVPVADDDTPETLAARVFAEECKAFPEAIGLYAEGRLTIDGRRVRIASD